MHESDDFISSSQSIESQNLARAIDCIRQVIPRTVSHSNHPSTSLTTLTLPLFELIPRSCFSDAVLCGNTLEWRYEKPLLPAPKLKGIKIAKIDLPARADYYKVKQPVPPPHTNDLVDPEVIMPDGELRKPSSHKLQVFYDYVVTVGSQAVKKQ